MLLAAGAGAARSAHTPCGTASPGSAHNTHVIWILEENHSYETIIGSSQAPYINALQRNAGWPPITTTSRTRACRTTWVSRSRFDGDVVCRFPSFLFQ